MPTEEQIRERLPVWETLGELFLDTELVAAELKRIAAVLARSKYSEEDLLRILRHEVYPACSPNLTSVAGEWTSWDPAWIRSNIAPRYDLRHSLPAFQWHLIKDQWNIVKGLVKVLRLVPVS